VAALDPALRLGSDGFGAGTVLTAAGCELLVVATPGHSADSLSLLVTADGALLTGDTVLGRGTTVIAGDGSLADYLRTLDELRSLAEAAGLRTLLPGHGPVLADPAGVLDFYIAHRRERLDQVRAALAAGARTTAEIVEIVYADTDPAVRRAAEWSVRAQLDYLNALLGAGFWRDADQDRARCRVQKVRQRPARRQLCQPVPLVRADHDGCRVGLAGQPEQRVRHRRVVGHRQRAGIKPGLLGERRALVRHLLGFFGGRSFRREGSPDIDNARRLNRLLGKRRLLEAPAGFPDEHHERGPRREEGAGLPHRQRRRLCAIKSNDDRSPRHILKDTHDISRGYDRSD
jgi:hypothetical protein